MTDEQINLLKQFETRTTVGMACFNALGQQKHFAVPAWICEAFKAGHIERGLDARGFADTEPVVDSPRIYGREFVLTDKGRFAVALPVAKTVKVVAKSKGLFDE